MRVTKSRPWTLAGKAARLVTRRPAPTIPKLIGDLAPGKSFADLGGMFLIDGEHTFLAADAGATSAICVDMREISEKFEREASKRSGVEYLQGDFSSPHVAEKLGVVDVVWCWGVLYHHPSPYQLLRSLYRICGERLVIETLVIPEVHGLPNAAVYFPYQEQGDRVLWDVPYGRRTKMRTERYAISTAYRPDLGYTNNFWGMSPSCVSAVMRTAGFRVERVLPSPNGVFRKVFVARVIPNVDDME